MEYTKGEWKAEKSKLGEWLIMAETEHTISGVATVARHFDAHLIAAAPKLYEALKVAHRELLHAQWEDGLDQIEQALAKVEGD